MYVFVFASHCSVVFLPFLFLSFAYKLLPLMDTYLVPRYVLLSKDVYNITETPNVGTMVSVSTMQILALQPFT